MKIGFDLSEESTQHNLPKLFGYLVAAYLILARNDVTNAIAVITACSGISAGVSTFTTKSTPEE